MLCIRVPTGGTWTFSSIVENIQGFPNLLTIASIKMRLGFCRITYIDGLSYRKTAWKIASKDISE